jgi:hypothetical protein
MTYKGIYVDGDNTVAIQFIDQEAFLKWEVNNHEIKVEATRIISECPDTKFLTAAHVEAIRTWLQHVNAMVEAGTPVLPSILSAANDFIRAIAVH